MLELMEKYIVHILYVSVVGSLMYVMVYNKPTISQAISLVTRYMVFMEKKLKLPTGKSISKHQRFIDNVHLLTNDRRPKIHL